MRARDAGRFLRRRNGGHLGSRMGGMKGTELSGGNESVYKGINCASMGVTVNEWAKKVGCTWRKRDSKSKHQKNMETKSSDQ